MQDVIQRGVIWRFVGMLLSVLSFFPLPATKGYCTFAREQEFVSVIRE